MKTKNRYDHLEWAGARRSWNPDSFRGGVYYTGMGIDPMGIFLAFGGAMICSWKGSLCSRGGGDGAGALRGQDGGNGAVGKIMLILIAIFFSESVATVIRAFPKHF